MGKVSLVFGLVCGGIAFSFFLFVYFRAEDALSGGRLLLDAFSTFLFIVAAIWYYRRTRGRGRLHFWEGLTIGFLTNLISALVSAGLVYGFITFIDPAVLPRHLAALEEMLLARKDQYVALAGEKNFQQQLAETRLTTPGIIFWDEWFKKMLLMLAVPVVTLLLRRQPYSLINPGGPPEKKPGS